MREVTTGQSYEEQVKELKASGCERIFEDKASGKNTNRPGFQKLCEALLPGDTVVICKLDRIGRNTQDMIAIVDGYKDQGIGFKVLDNAQIDTTTPNGKVQTGDRQRLMQTGDRPRLKLGTVARFDSRVSKR
jgi:DNA invertase Pin-like site-specific DNA recombinase